MNAHGVWCKYKATVWPFPASPLHVIRSEPDPELGQIRGAFLLILGNSLSEDHLGITEAIMVTRMSEQERDPRSIRGSDGVLPG